ncbi:hypothetical protein [Rubripirellula reticaptiva]|uniref:Uncharacterized protein n=1 Tax=Rubripirellula reticaptiva TaxID=2528013 RepID=A0A5C6FD35_9BACT|nr:hypothetical protein [Rubripirellula reticaptiva]TWU57569.1 hypothetical protein Poly59_04760 [Rubripirellula reticaptiva]
MIQDDNVVIRLKKRLAHARKAGFKVRIEVLDDEQPGWCQVGSSRILFLNIAQTAAEQLAQLEETLQDFAELAKLSSANRGSVGGVTGGLAEKAPSDQAA